jgi:plasmid stabilization system protein ParE
MAFEVVFAEAARGDLERLHEYLLSRAETVEDLSLADRAADEIELACKVQLARTPHLFRKAGTSLTRRELVITFGATGCVALYEISVGTVFVLAVRHQLEDDYH